MSFPKGICVLADRQRPNLNDPPSQRRRCSHHLALIRELATYERAADHVKATEADLLRDGFSLAPDGSALPSPSRFRALIADWQPVSNTTPEPAGFALFFPSYSTWVGHHGLRLEDFYVTPHLRSHGVGKALLRQLAQIAVHEGCQRLEWDVLTWNEPAINVYKRLGGEILEEWRIVRLSGDALQSLADSPAVS